MYLFPNGNLAETYYDGSAIWDALPANFERPAYTMVACPNCPARFASTREIEREWMEKHQKRAHGDERITRINSRFRFAGNTADLRKAS